MSEQKYSTYVLRMWQDGIEWRASLKDAQGGKQHNFVSLEPLVEFLHNQTRQKLPPNNGDTK